MTDADKRIAAQHDYELGMKYKDIATKYGVSINTVRSWKTRYKWQRNKSKKDVHINQKDVHTKRPTDAAINQLNDSNLKDKQKAFVLDYLRLFNATQAYINVYDVDYSNAKTSGPRLLENVGIQKQIKQIRKANLKEVVIEPLDLIEDVTKEAKADISNYLDFGSWSEKIVEKKKTKKAFNDDKVNESNINVVRDKPILDTNGK